MQMREAEQTYRSFPPLVNYVSSSRELPTLFARLPRHYAKRIIICHSPVREEHWCLGEDIPQEGSRRRHVRQNDGCKNTADSGTASVSCLVATKVNRQVAKQMIMRGWQSRQQFLRRGDPRVVIVRIALCDRQF